MRCPLGGERATLVEVGGDQVDRLVEGGGQRHLGRGDRGAAGVRCLEDARVEHDLVRSGGGMRPEPNLQRVVARQGAGEPGHRGGDPLVPGDHGLDRPLFRREDLVQGRLTSLRHKPPIVPHRSKAATGRQAQLVVRRRSRQLGSTDIPGRSVGPVLMTARRGFPRSPPSTRLSASTVASPGWPRRRPHPGGAHRLGSTPCGVLPAPHRPRRARRDGRPERRDRESAPRPALHVADVLRQPCSQLGDRHRGSHVTKLVRRGARPGGGH